MDEAIPASQAMSRYDGGSGWLYIYRDKKTIVWSSDFPAELSPLLSKITMTSGIPNSSRDVQNDHPADGAGWCPVG
jgi:hypothetical protein